MSLSFSHENVYGLYAWHKCIRKYMHTHTQHTHIYIYPIHPPVKIPASWAEQMANLPSLLQLDHLHQHPPPGPVFPDIFVSHPPNVLWMNLGRPIWQTPPTKTGPLPSLKLTAFSPLKMDGWNTTFLLMDGWNTILSYWVKRPIFRGELAASFSQGG